MTSPLTTTTASIVLYRRHSKPAGARCYRLVTPRNPKTRWHLANSPAKLASWLRWRNLGWKKGLRSPNGLNWPNSRAPGRDRLPDDDAWPLIRIGLAADDELAHFPGHVAFAESQVAPACGQEIHVGPAE